MTKLKHCVSVLGFTLGVILVTLGVSRMLRNSNNPPITEKEGLFFIVSYDKIKGTINDQILCDYIRKDSERGEIVCREWKTNEYYIFSYPISVTDVTKTKDYIKFTNEK